MIENDTWYNGQYIDIIAVQCTLPNNFQMCKAFDNGLCFSGCGTCTPGNAQQLLQPDNSKKTECNQGEKHERL